VAGGWRKLHIEELQNLHSALDLVRVTKSRRVRWVGNVAFPGEVRSAHKILVDKPEGNEPLGIRGRRREDSVNRF